jgi:hypothetical protein
MWEQENSGSFGMRGKFIHCLAAKTYCSPPPGFDSSVFAWVLNAEEKRE